VPTNGVYFVRVIEIEIKAEIENRSGDEMTTGKQIRLTSLATCAG
jgi:hypothetical protein